MPRGIWKIKIRPDENLAKIIGKDDQTPSDMIKNLWKYIKKNDLKKAV